MATRTPKAETSQAVSRKPRARKLKAAPSAPAPAAAATPTGPTVEVLPAAPRKGKRADVRAKKARQRLLHEKVLEAIDKATSRIVSSHEMTIKKTGQRCIAAPWQAASDRPWREGYTRVMIMLDTPTVKGKRCLYQIVRNDHLSHESHS